MEKKMEHEMETAFVGLYKDYMSYSLNSLEGGVYIGDNYKGA